MMERNTGTRSTCLGHTNTTKDRKDDYKFEYECEYRYCYGYGHCYAHGYVR